MCSSQTIINCLAVSLVAALVSFRTVLSMCPDKLEGLQRWSDPSTWPGNDKPTENGNVYINSMVLLDESPPRLHSIVIQPHARLVWSSDGDYTLYTDYILIHGRMDIGSEDCKFHRKAHIVLTGIRGDYTPVVLPGPFHFNEKFIGIAPGGTLELHGRQKLSWTKLTQTVEKLVPSNGLIYSHKESEMAYTDNWKPGLLVYVIDETTSYPVFGQFYYVGGSDDFWTNTDIPQLISTLEGVEDGNIVTIAVNKNTVGPSVDLSRIADAIETIIYGVPTGASKFRSLGYNDAYTLVAQKGNPALMNEDVSPNHGTYTEYARSDLTFWNQGMKIVVESFIDNQAEIKSWVNVRVATLHGAYPILNLLDDVSSWDVGDKIVLSSTDYDWEQTEEAIIVECPECSSHQVKVEMDSKFMHWGEVIDGVDERGEVSLLTRNILIEGEMQHHCPPSNGNCDKFNYDTFGGHIKFVRGFENGHIEGVELYHMGQQTAKGHYPVHFHMTYEVGDKEHPPYINDNSVHKSYARCYTIHGTHGVSLKGNVGYDCLGHCYFLEDGGEKRTVFDGNIGLSTRKGLLIPSDRTPSTFWITNPLTYLRNNVAAGSEYIGIWHVFPNAPVGLTVGLPGFMEYDEAKHTPYLEWTNNVAHSNPEAGLYIENIVFPDDTVGGENDYAPREDPFDPSSPPVNVEIIKPTLYKNRQQNAFIRGGGFHVIHGSFADSAIGITFARSTDQVQDLVDSVIIGQTENIGEPTKIWENNRQVTMPRSFPVKEDISFPVRGLNLFDSAVYVNNVRFAGFTNDEFRSAGAISFTKNSQTATPLSTMENCQFDNGDGGSPGDIIYVGYAPEYEDGAGVAFKDIDGSVTGVEGALVQRVGGSEVDEPCDLWENWNVAVCPSHDESAPNSPAVYALKPKTPQGRLGAGVSKVNNDSHVVDGGFGEWTVWHECVITNEGSFQWRFRFCDKPLPQNGGRLCIGPTSQSRSCQMMHPRQR